MEVPLPSKKPIHTAKYEMGAIRARHSPHMTNDTDYIAYSTNFEIRLPQSHWL